MEKKILARAWDAGRRLREDAKGMGIKLNADPIRVDAGAGGGGWVVRMSGHIGKDPVGSDYHTDGRWLDGSSGTPWGKGRFERYEDAMQVASAICAGMRA